MHSMYAVALPAHPCRRTVPEARDNSPSAASHETQSTAHAATPGTCGCHQPLCHPTAVFESLQTSLLHCHGRSVCQQRVLSPLSSSIRPARGLSAALWLLQRCIDVCVGFAVQLALRSPRLASSPTAHMAPEPDWDLAAGPAIARAAAPLYPVQIRLHRLLDSTRRGSTGAAASRCIRLDIRKANRGRRCRTVCKCDLQTRLASCTPGHVCYDEKRRLLPVGSGSYSLRYLQFSSQIFDVWIDRYPCGRVACI